LNKISSVELQSDIDEIDKVWMLSNKEEPLLYRKKLLQWQKKLPLLSF